MELVDLAQERMAERQLWCNGDLWDETATSIAVGELAGGRWYVSRRSGRMLVRACAYAGPAAEHYARGTARRWRRTLGGRWTAIH
jgi:hypothetical protein